MQECFGIASVVLNFAKRHKGKDVAVQISVQSIMDDYPSNPFEDSAAREYTEVHEHENLCDMFENEENLVQKTTCIESVHFTDIPEDFHDYDDAFHDFQRTILKISKYCRVVLHLSDSSMLREFDEIEFDEKYINHC